MLIVALIFYALFFGIAQPVSKYYGYIILVSQLQFGFLVVAFLMLAAAGYIINDYFDRKADLINRPDTVVIGVHIKRRWAIVLHTLFNAIGIALGFAVSVSVGMWWFGFLFVLFSLLLWWYSSNLKRIPLLGNLLVAVLAGVVPMVFAGFLFYGSIHVSESYNVAMNDVLKHIFNLSLGFAVFAFLFSFIREIVKDSEDVKGDRAMYCKTLPIVLGMGFTKRLISLLCFTSAFLVVLAYYGYIMELPFMKDDYISVWYIASMIVAPVLYCGVRVNFALHSKDFKFLSSLLKYIMVLGILYILIIRMVIYSNIL